MKFTGSWWFILLKRRKIKKAFSKFDGYVKAYITSNTVQSIIKRPLLKRRLVVRILCIFSYITIADALTVEKFKIILRSKMTLKIPQPRTQQTMAWAQRCLCTTSVTHGFHSSGDFKNQPNQVKTPEAHRAYRLYSLVLYVNELCPLLLRPRGPEPLFCLMPHQPWLHFLSQWQLSKAVVITPSRLYITLV